MIIYVNEQYEFITLDNALENYKDAFEVDQTRLELFGNFCDAVIQEYKYEPQYEFLFNDDCSNAREKNWRIVL